MQAPLIESLPAHPKKLTDTIAVWSEMKDLQVKYNCLSLGEGAPNIMPPEFLIEDMVAAMKQSLYHNKLRKKSQTKVDRPST